MKKILFSILALAIIGFGLYGLIAYKNSYKQLNNIGIAYKAITPLSATSTSATSTVINIRGAKKVSLFWTSDVWASGYGTSTLTVTGSADDSTYFALNKLVDNVANSNSQTITRLASKAVSATTTSYMLSLDLANDTLNSIKVSVNKAGLATNTVESIIEY